MNIRAKFVCTASHAESGSVALIPVVASADNEENTKFFQATPGGAISMSGMTPEVTNQFVAGSSYYVDFTPVSPPAEQEAEPEAGDAEQK